MRRNSPSELSTPIAVLSSRLLGAEEVRQLGDIHRNASRLIPRHQMRSRSPSRLILEIDVSERVPVGVADDVAGLGLPGQGP